MAGCGASTVSVTSPPAAASTEPTTQQTTQTQATTVATTPASSAVSTWMIRMTPSGGYVIGATIALDAPQHFSATDLPQCQGDPQTDAEIPGTLTVTDETRNFPDEPGIEIHSLTGATIADSSNCIAIGNLPGIAFTATSPQSYGQSISEKIWVVVPNYYNPNHPNGNTALLANVQLQPGYYNSNQPGAVALFHISGPNIQGQGNNEIGGGIFSLESLANG